MKIKTSEDFVNFCETAKRVDLINEGFRIMEINKPKEKTMWLIPNKFYDLIPEGFPVYTAGIFKETFSRETHFKQPLPNTLLYYGIIKPINIIKTKNELTRTN